MTNPNGTPLLSPAGQLNQVARVILSKHDQSMTILRDAAVQALRQDERVCALASEDYCEATVAKDMFGVLVVARLISKSIHSNKTWPDMYVAIKTDDEIHEIHYGFTPSSGNVRAYSVGANPVSYQFVGSAMQDGTYKGEPENPFQKVGEPKAISLAQHAASVLLHGEFKPEITEAYGTEEHITARGLDPDVLHRVSMVDSWAPTDETPAE